MARIDPDSSMRSHFIKCFDSGLYSDLRIRDSNGHEYRVHRVIVCGRSSVFANSIKPEHGFKEAQTGVINLEHHDPLAVKAMLHFMYHGNLCIDDENANSMVFAAHVYELGEMYCVQGLKQLAANEFNEISFSNWTVDDFAEAVKFVYGSFPDTNDCPIRLTIAKRVVEKYRTLPGKPEFGAVLDEFGILGRDILRQISSTDIFGARKYRCSGDDWDSSPHTAIMMLDLAQPGSLVYCPICGVSDYLSGWAEREVE